MAKTKFAAPPELVAMIKAMLSHYGGRIGKPKPVYPGTLRAGRSPAFEMSRAMLMQRLGQGGPDAWKRAEGFGQRWQTGRREPTRGSSYGGGAGGGMGDRGGPEAGMGSGGLDPEIIRMLMQRQGGGG